VTRPVLGVDQSLTSTGLALVLASGIHTRTIESSPDEGLMGTRRRIRYIVGRSLRFIGEHVDLDGSVQVLSVIEAPLIPHGHQAGQILERAWLFGMLVDQLAIWGPIAQVRSATRAKYATGNGKAEKSEVLAAMRAEHPAAQIPNDDVADALALAAMGARRLGAPIDGASKARTAAVAVVAWPKLERGTE
jgi:hypothetical protein